MQNALGEYQTMLLLGGRSDIGLAVAARLASPFTRKIILAGRSMVQQDADTFRAMLEKKGLDSIDILLRDFDATDCASHTSFAESLEGEDVDLVIFAFGRLGDNEAMRRDPKAAADLVSVNMSGIVSSGLACADLLDRQGRGHLVFLSSVAGVRPRKSNFIYGATKAGMDAFAQGLADAVAPNGIKVTIVRPGFVHSAMTHGLDAAPFATSVDQVADCVAEGMRKGRRIIWAPGILRYVFLVLRVLPTPVWRRLPLK